jgi:hypothetical protein
MIFLTAPVGPEPHTVAEDPGGAVAEDEAGTVGVGDPDTGRGGEETAGKDPAGTDGEGRGPAEGPECEQAEASRQTAASRTPEPRPGHR